MNWYLTLIPVIYLLFLWDGKVNFYDMMKGKEPVKAIVVEYKKEKSPMRNDYTQLKYPYVRIKEDDPHLTRLKYASMTKQFKIGEEVEVFFYGQVLYYWKAHDQGIDKFLPSRWDFWNKD